MAARPNNATVSWNNREGVRITIPIRVRKFTTRYEVIADESHARTDRGFYPKNRAIGIFTITIEFNGYNKMMIFMNQLKQYCYDFVDIAVPSEAITVDISDRADNLHFIRRGIPVSGMIDEDHVGSNVFSPTIKFEALQDPLDTQIWTAYDPSAYISRFDPNGVVEWYDGSRFWYPVLEGSNNPYAAPEAIFNAPPTSIQQPAPPRPAQPPPQDPAPAPAPGGGGGGGGGGNRNDNDRAWWEAIGDILF